MVRVMILTARCWIIQRRALRGVWTLVVVSSAIVMVVMSLADVLVQVHVLAITGQLTEYGT